MENIKNFKIDKQKDAYQNILSVKKATEKYVDQETLFANKELRRSFECPADFVI